MDLITLNQTLGMGGAENFNLSLAKYLKEQGHQIYFYSNYEPLIKLLHEKNIPAYRVPFVVDIIGDWKGLIKGIIYGPLLFIYYLKIILSHREVKVYYFTGYIEKILCSPLLKLMNKKIVWIEFGPLQPVFRKFFHLPEILYRLAALFPDKIIFSSQNSLNSNRPYYSSNKHLLVVPLGSPSPVLITKAESFDVLSLSRLEPGKGQDILLKAWPAVIKQVPRAKLIIVGEGDSKYSTYLKKLAPPGVVFTGRVIDQFAYLAACKFLVFPSIWNLEGFGLVITEAFSLGKPVVAFDHPPGNEIVKSGINGLLTPDNDSLAENIVYLLKNPAVLKRLSRGAKLDFETHFRETIYLHKYADTLLC